LKGGEAHTTNNRMELMAAISALEALKKPCTVDLYTDSQYVRRASPAGSMAGRRTAGAPPTRSRSRTSISGSGSTPRSSRIRCAGTGSRATPATTKTNAPINWRPPQRPIVLAAHWAAGVATLVAQQAVADFARVDSVALAALFDLADAVGPMSAADAAAFTGRALLRRGGDWIWVDMADHPRSLRLADGHEATVQPLAAFDAPSLAAITGAPDVRFDFGEGDSIGTRAGGRASHEVYVEIEGVLASGRPARRRVVVSDPKGVGHMTALGTVVIAERVLGLDGLPLQAGGLHLPETLVAPDAAIARFEQSGMRITREDEAA
jgi:hypothetical protein